MFQNPNALASARDQILYAFPPLLSLTIKKDLHLTQNEIANSNIIALVATLLVRLVAGPCCDHFGPKVTFAGCLLLGAIPTALAVWSTGFFDKNIVGTASSLTGGWGNAGGGITYFVMPAIVDSLMLNQGLTAHVAWRVSFIVPFILITTTAISMLIFCPDTPTGKWSQTAPHRATKSPSPRHPQTTTPPTI
ncbi:hypothetical protein DID88_004275 [Monilinia fructigena]|uniref:Major facilitator superfamily (MFS) profile domain-containing protein n=1 Tax=Monilinia fructigena TaxID=38457 RepID=A0A395ISZ9_9HELO|nr:hypothetical protein DID88_004275 [Monilinia fructigena]